MRLIKSNNIDSTCPKYHICDECGAELEYDKEDVHIGWMGCGKETAISDHRLKPTTWSTTFYHTNTETGAFDIEDDKIREYVNQTVKRLCSDEWKPGEFYVTETGNLLVVGVKWEDGVDIYVTKDYWEDNITPEDYGMVK